MEIINNTLKINNDFSVKIWDFNEIKKLNIKNKYFNKSIAKKQWAFASDYLRLKILYEYGGIYLDTDLHSLKKISNFLDKQNNVDLILGFEYKYLVSTGFIWARKSKNKIIKKILNYYDNFDKYNDPKKIKFIVNNYIWTYVLVKDHNLLFKDQNQILKDKILIVNHNYFSSINKAKEESFFLHKHLLSWKENHNIRKLMIFILSYIQEHKILNPFLKIQIELKLRKIKKIYKNLK
ncbi:MAG: glycosyl transferase [Candidatus Hepatoplasma scabrum]|nr:MAG: glycosyl transferase [Candidatus Hepatoplasma sp.]